MQIGTVPERLSALDKGRVQAAMLNPPDNVMAQKRGLNSLVGVRLPYQGVGVSSTRSFIRENPDIVRRYVKSQVEAVHRIKTDRELGLKVLAKYVASPDKEILERTYDDISSDDKLSPKQYPTLEGIKNILEPLAENDAKAKAAKPEDFADMRFIKELDESGFIDDLYKGRKRVDSPMQKFYVILLILILSTEKSRRLPTSEARREIRNLSDTEFFAALLGQM